MNNVETEYYVEGSKIVLEKTGNNVLYYVRNSVDGLIGFYYNNDYYYYLKNNQNDIIGISSVDGLTTALYEYDSWGNIISVTNENGMDISGFSNHPANLNPFRYRGYYYDKETKLYYLNNRYYNPKWGRFINADGTIGSNGDILGYNLYAYCSNNPIMNSDSSGNGLLKNLFKKAKSIVKNVVKAAVSNVGLLSKKNIVRTSVNICAAISSQIGMENAARLLTHSLRDNPQDVEFKSDSKISQKIINSQTFQKYIEDKISVEENGYIDKKFDGLVFPFSTDLDLGLGIHESSVHVQGYLENGSGNLKITLSDVYDFKIEELDSFIHFINNIAYAYQEEGIINTYNVKVNIDYCLRCH